MFRIKRYLFIISCVCALAGLGLLVHYSMDTDIMKSKHTVPVVTTWQYVWMTSDQMRDVVSDIRKDRDNLLSEFNKKKLLLEEKESKLDYANRALDRVRCQDTGLSQENHCKKINWEVF